MNNISFYLFPKYSIMTVIFTCCDDLVTYDLSKEFLVVEIEEGEVDNIPKKL